MSERIAESGGQSTSSCLGSPGDVFITISELRETYGGAAQCSKPVGSAIMYQLVIFAHDAAARSVSKHLVKLKLIK